MQEDPSPSHTPHASSVGHAPQLAGQDSLIRAVPHTKSQPKLATADAHVKGLQYLLDGGDAIALNLGNGVGFSVKKVVKTVEQIVGRVPCIETERRLGDPPSLVASSELATQVLGWTPAYPSLESIITDAWEWRKSLGE